MGKYKLVSTIKGNPELLFNRAKREAEKYNASISGNASAGIFNVIILSSRYQGRYTVSGNTLEIIIHDKPFYISGKIIESMIKQFLNS